MITQPVSCSQGLDLSLLGSTVLLLPQRPCPGEASPSPASSLLTQIQPSFKALLGRTKASSGLWLCVPPSIHSQVLRARRPPQVPVWALSLLQRSRSPGSVVRFHSFALISFDTPG